MRMTTEGDGSEVHEQMPMQRLILVRDLQLEDRKKHPKENGLILSTKATCLFQFPRTELSSPTRKKKTQANPVILSISIVSLSLFFYLSTFLHLYALSPQLSRSG